MGLFKRNNTVKEACVADGMWNIFTKAPLRVVDLRKGWRFRKWSRLDVPLVEFVWKALSEVLEEEYWQYAWVFKDGAEIDNALSKLLVFDDGFVYNGVKCRRVVVPSSSSCNEYGICKALILRSPEGVIRRLWHLYEMYKAKKIESA